MNKVLLGLEERTFTRKDSAMFDIAVELVANDSANGDIELPRRFELILKNWFSGSKRKKALVTDRDKIDFVALVKKDLEFI